VPAGALWESRLPDGSAPVWLLEWRLRPHMRRHVLIAVDTSDSCAPYRGAVRDALEAIGRTLRPGDRCALWTVGSTREPHRLVIDDASDATRLSTWEARLPRHRNGTWIASTMRAMLAEQELPDERRLIVIVSDGEVFDIDETPATAARAAWIRVGPASEHCIPGLEKLDQPGAIDRFLASPAPVAIVEPGWSGMRASRYGADGSLLGGDPFSVEAGARDVRVVMVGGNRPQPRIVYQADGVTWADADVLAEDAPDSRPHLRRVVRALTGSDVQWDMAILARLAAGQDVALTCPQRHDVTDARRRLFCRQCSCLVLASNSIRRADLPNEFRKFVRFAIGDDGVIGSAEPTDRQTGDAAFEVITDQGTGQRWLLLNLRKA
jgi:hypothetical protein